MNDRNGNPISIGAEYLVVGEALAEFSADKVALDTKRQILVDNTSSGAAPTVAQVSTDLLPLTSLAAASHAHSAADITSGTLDTARLPTIQTAQLGGDITTAGKALLDDATAADQRTTLGLGTAATRNMGVGASDLVDLGTMAATFSAIGHTHAASDIASGTIAVARLPAATTSAQGIVELATNGENAANVVVQGNDSRLSDARTPTSHTHNASDINAGTLGAARLPALSGAVTSSAGSATTAFGSFKANSILMNMTNGSAVPTAVDGTDAAANLWAMLGGSYLLLAWDMANLKLGSIAI